MSRKRILLELEDEMRGIEVKLSGYLHSRRRYRMTDREDIKRRGLKLLRQKVKNTTDLGRFIDYHYYLGKWMAYQYVLGWIVKRLIRIRRKERKEKRGG